MHIKEVKSKGAYQLAAQLFQEYAKEIGIDLEFQNFQEELSDLQKQYSRPKGAIFVAYDTNQMALGCVAIRKLEDSVCELKRMYVRKEFQGIGLGTQLLQKCIETATILGYSKMRLDTLASMHSAIHVYTKAGFYEIQSYRFNPFDEAKYYELELTLPNETPLHQAKIRDKRF